MLLMPALDLAPVAATGKQSHVRGYLAQSAQVMLWAEGVMAFIGGVMVEPGQDGQVTASMKLPANADVARVKARAVLTPPGGQKGQAADVTVTEGKGESAKVKSYALDTSAPLPRTVAVALQGGEVLHQASGPAGEAEALTADFAGELNAYLDRLGGAGDAGGEVPLVFAVTTDQPVMVRIEIAEVAFSRIVTTLWPHPAEEGLRSDRTVQTAFGETLALLLPAPGGAELSAVELDISGSAGPARLMGRVPVPGVVRCSVSGDFAVAQPLAQAGTGAVSGAAFHLATEAAAEVHVGLYADAVGAPAPGAPLAEAVLALDAPAEPAGPRWLSVDFPQPVPPGAGAAWLVLRAVSGTAWLSTGVGEASARISRAGQGWRGLVGGAPSALLFGTHEPSADAMIPPVELSLPGGAPVAVDLGAEPQRITLAAAPGTPLGEAVLTLTSRALATVTLANATQRYGAEERGA